MVLAYLGLGSNLGDRRGFIDRAQQCLKNEPGIRFCSASRIVETKPLGPQDQPDYLNGVVKIETLLSPVGLLDSLLVIERRLGRQRLKRWGPRTIDLDILLYGDRIVEHPRVRIPHPELCYRPFLQEGIRELHGPLQRF
jgi:2-amino-4-hydroxy-6-hydroxymethyldihydropteridine diphosphokinase